MSEQLQSPGEYRQANAPAAPSDEISHPAESRKRLAEIILGSIGVILLLLLAIVNYLKIAG